MRTKTNQSKKTLNLYLYISPAWIMMGAIVIFPILYLLYISFTNMNIYHWTDYKLIGFHNYFKALTRIEQGFLKALFTTLIWTLSNVLVQVVLALIISLFLNVEGLIGKGFYKTILIIPWAMPSYISALIWRNGLFHNDYGMLNGILRAWGFQKVAWLNTDSMAFVSCMMVNLWMALPFMILVIFGGLQSIDRSYYESASLDGCSSFKAIFYITLPLIRPILIPAVVLTTFVTFKQFDIVYLMLQQTGLKTGANIHTVITYAYENAFITNNYGYSAATSVIIFIIIVFLTLCNKKYIKAE